MVVGEEIAVARVVKLKDEWRVDSFYELAAQTNMMHSSARGEVRGGRSSGEEVYAERQERVRGGSEAGLRSGVGSAHLRRQRADALGALDKLHSLRLEIPEAACWPKGGSFLAWCGGDTEWAEWGGNGEKIFAFLVPRNTPPFIQLWTVPVGSQVLCARFQVQDPNLFESEIYDTHPLSPKFEKARGPPRSNSARITFTIRAPNQAPTALGSFPETKVCGVRV